MPLRPETRAWAVWSAGLAAYVIAVLHRTSLGVAGLDAQHRFDIGASALATFAVLQLLVYAGLQIPVGMLLDRFGSLRLVLSGALLMAAGQSLMAFTDDMTGAVVARVLVGAGDAMTFISVLRLVPHWFPARRVPVLTQVTGIVGQIGQLLSAVPLAALLAGPGWTTAFVGAAGAGVFVALVAFAALHDTPERRMNSGSAVTWQRLSSDLSSAWRHPGTRLGLWTHFTTQFTGTVFALMWGVPFLIAGEGLSRSAASSLLILFVLTGMASGPVLGMLTQRYPLRRSLLVLGVVAANMGAWALVIAWPGQAPMPLLVLLVVALGLGGPGSMIGFDYARTFNPPSRLGTATGVVNVGGFVASLLTILLIGLILDARTGGSADYHIDDFRVAMSVQFAVAAIGVLGILRTRRLARQKMEQEEGIVIRPLLKVLAERRELARQR
ncbi:putative MFS transporter [Actinoplanes missouriensis 431]|uniref:Putative MFS transporter n=1 Tax=Actinoplanes missouriensis (strain ATCC 14538 / DSM 43046 / CBS 188.64 / JCM 3121 / NBRC 102363 / NCIMB 12654 / NRRL B-3342 / UNCC 431) TaxID=512565 RepID=I0HFN2_ACTM4|nr:MFS transporter [Actinoplanes missouriensis]BAL91819.1 putative MFS transporter [Actinoplanes missouriensis 431]